MEGLDHRVLGIAGGDVDPAGASVLAAARGGRLEMMAQAVTATRETLRQAIVELRTTSARAQLLYYVALPSVFGAVLAMGWLTWRRSATCLAGW